LTVFNSIVFCLIYFSGDTFLSLVKPNDSMDEMNQKMFIDVLQTGLDGIDANNVDDGRDGNGLKRMSSVPSGQLKRNSLASGSMTRPFSSPNLVPSSSTAVSGSKKKKRRNHVRRPSVLALMQMKVAKKRINSLTGDNSKDEAEVLKVEEAEEVKVEGEKKEKSDEHDDEKVIATSTMTAMESNPVSDSAVQHIYKTAPPPPPLGTSKRYSFTGVDHILYEEEEEEEEDEEEVELEEGGTKQLASHHYKRKEEPEPTVLPPRPPRTPPPPPPSFLKKSSMASSSRSKSPGSPNEVEDEVHL